MPGIMMLAESGGVTDALTTSFTSIGADLTSMIGKVLPIALPIIGSVMVVTFGIKIFRKVTGAKG